MSPDEVSKIQEIEHKRRMADERLKCVRNEMNNLLSEESRWRAALVRFDNELASLLKKEVV